MGEPLEPATGRDEVSEEVVAAPAEGEIAATPEAGAAGAPTEPEVAKKGKAEPADAAGAKKPEAGAKK